MIDSLRFWMACFAIGTAEYDLIMRWLWHSNIAAWIIAPLVVFSIIAWALWLIYWVADLVTAKDAREAREAKKPTA